MIHARCFGLGCEAEKRQARFHDRHEKQHGTLGGGVEVSEWSLAPTVPRRCVGAPTEPATPTHRPASAVLPVGSAPGHPRAGARARVTVPQ
eukprot:290397-Prymnesium_polylepis.1